MLNHRNSSVFFCAILGFLLGLNYFIPFSKWLYVAPIVAFSLLVFYGTVTVGSNYYLPVLCQGPFNQKEIAITFDDGPVEKNTDQILDILKQNNLHATFFCIGKNMAATPDIVKRIVQEGHTLGNHSYSHHFFFDMYSTKKMKHELGETNNLVEKLVNKKMKLFRPPYGVINPNLTRAIRALDFSPVGWSVRSMDTVTKDPEVLLKKISDKIQPGAVFLFHDTASATIASLQKFINIVTEKGFRVVPLENLLNVKAYA
jgi:peptidoglycan/xylan/chitin deacetylase (PgdA/CDA1 family)